MTANSDTATGLDTLPLPVIEEPPARWAPPRWAVVAAAYLGLFTAIIVAAALVITLGGLP
jgi:hypothetical protein